MIKIEPSPHLVNVGQSVTLTQLPTRADSYHPNRDEAEAEFEALRDEFIEWQRRLYAEGKQKLLIVLQATDAGGKDSAIKKMTRGINPQGVRVTSFKVPSKEELAHDFLWRVHKNVPAKGMIGIFNRSHYEDVIVVRVHDIVPQAIWEPRFEQINQFEKLLADTGTHILKFYLHISKEEQKERFQDRLDNPDKWWKFSLEDLEKRKLWDDYMQAFEDMLEKCSTEYAPWHIIPADQKWYRNIAIMRVIVHRLRQMNPQYPQPEGDYTNIVIP